MADPTTQAIRFEGMGEGTSAWGYTQANFLVHTPGRHGREIAVQVNDPACKYVASQLGQADSPELRDQIARAAGECWLPVVLAEQPDLPAIVTVSKAFLDEHPDILAAIKAALA